MFCASSLGEKLITKMCGDKDIDLLKAAIQLPEDDESIVQHTQSALRTIQHSNTRIHILIAGRSDQVIILDTIRYFDSKLLGMGPTSASVSFSPVNPEHTHTLCPSLFSFFYTEIQGFSKRTMSGLHPWIYRIQLLF